MADDSNSAAPEPLPEAQPGGGAAAAKEPKKESLWSFLRFLLLLFVATILLRSLVIAPFNIPSGSMIPTLMVGDYLFVSKWSYGYSRYSFPFGILGFDGRIMERVPERGDVVVFRHPVRDDDLIKRVIGVPGDRISLSGGVVTLNGQPLPRERIADFVMPVSVNNVCKDEGQGDIPGMRMVQDENGQPACAFDRYRETLPGGRSYEVLDQFPAAPGDDVPEFTVPEGHLFVMGDNRDDSLDGRFPARPDGSGGVGMVPIQNLHGRALISFFSTDGSSEWIKPWTWVTAMRWSRIGQTYP